MGRATVGARPATLRRVHGAYRRRGVEVAAALIQAGMGPKIHALGVTKDGAPRHPLYLPYSAAPVRYPAA